MAMYEYRVIPAPTKGVKAKGLKSAEDRFAHTLQDIMNEQGKQGWEYQRTDTLPSEERSGLAKKVTVFQNMLVFRRLATTEEADEATPPTPVVTAHREAAPVQDTEEPRLTADADADA